MSFERIADEWLAWSRTPGHDAYWDHRDQFFALVPEPRGRTLEIGCGEGRVSRDLAARGHRVTALDPSPTLLAAAAGAAPEIEYVRGDAEALPFGDETFELVVAHHVLMDVGDMPRAVLEAARVLVPGGRLCAAIVHPMADGGRFDGDAEDASFVLEGSYLDSREVVDVIERDGLRMTFAGWHHPIEAYFRAFEAAALVVEALRESRAPSGRWSRLPNFLYVRAVRSPAGWPSRP